MKINLSQLSDGTYQHNDEGELAIRELLESVGFTTFTTNIPGQKNPLQDYGVEKFRTEQKITSNADRFHVEFYYDEACTRPSGFSLCTAELTLLIQPGSSNKHGSVWKVRLYRTCDIVAAADPTFKEGDFRYNQPYIASSGAFCVSIKARDIPHVWVGDIKRDGTKVIDTSQFIPNSHCVEQFNYHFSPDLMVLSPVEYYDTFGRY